MQKSYIYSAEHLQCQDGFVQICWKILNNISHHARLCQPIIYLCPLYRSLCPSNTVIYGPQPLVLVSCYPDFISVLILLQDTTSLNKSSSTRKSVYFFTSKTLYTIMTSFPPNPCYIKDFLQQESYFTEKTSFKHTSGHQNMKSNCICTKCLERITVITSYILKVYYTHIGSSSRRN